MGRSNILHVHVNAAVVNHVKFPCCFVFIHMFLIDDVLLKKNYSKLDNILVLNVKFINFHII